MGDIESRQLRDVRLVDPCLFMYIHATAQTVQHVYLPWQTLELF